MLNAKIIYQRPAGRNHVIDGLRAIAIIWVFFFHCWLFHGSIFEHADEAYSVFNSRVFVWISRGDLGVDLFFTISGFLIGNILLLEYKKKLTLKIFSFYARRFFRLTPVYIVVMAMCVFFLDGLNLEKAYANLLYINNYIKNSYMTWTWSLALEEQFYFLTPLFIVIVFPIFKSKRTILTLLFITPVVLKAIYFYQSGYNLPFNNRLFHQDWNDWFWDYYVLTHLRFGSVLAGFIGAYMFSYKKNEILVFFQDARRSNFFTIFSLFLLFFISTTYTGHLLPLSKTFFSNKPYFFNLIYESVHRELFSLCVVYLILASSCKGQGFILRIKKFLSLQFWFPVAQLSYSIYLFHVGYIMWSFPRISALLHGLVSDPVIISINIILAIVVTFLASTLLFLIVEIPCQDFGRRCIKKITN